MTDRKQSAVARRLAQKLDELNNQLANSVTTQLDQRLTQAEQTLLALDTKENITSNQATNTDQVLTVQLDPNISGTLANKASKASYFNYQTSNLSLNLGTTSGTKQFEKLSITVDPDLSYTKGQTVELLSTDTDTAFINGTVESYNPTTGALSIYTKRVGTGTSSRWKLNVSSETEVIYSDLDGGFVSTTIDGGNAATGGGYIIDGGKA